MRQIDGEVVGVEGYFGERSGQIEAIPNELSEQY